MDYFWPGNVRELQNVIQRYLAVGSVDFLETVPAEKDASVVNESPGKENLALGASAEFESLQDNVDALEKALIEKSLRECRGNKSKVAQKLKISRKTLSRKMERLKLD
jgi:DNA-binding NtrC family response regulator